MSATTQTSKKRTAKAAGLDAAVAKICQVMTKEIQNALDLSLEDDPEFKEDTSNRSKELALDDDQESKQSDLSKRSKESSLDQKAKESDTSKTSKEYIDTYKCGKWVKTSGKWVDDNFVSDNGDIYYDGGGLYLCQHEKNPHAPGGRREVEQHETEPDVTKSSSMVTSTSVSTAQTESPHVVSVAHQATVVPTPIESKLDQDENLQETEAVVPVDGDLVLAKDTKSVTSLVASSTLVGNADWVLNAEVLRRFETGKTTKEVMEAAGVTSDDLKNALRSYCVDMMKHEKLSVQDLNKKVNRRLVIMKNGQINQTLVFKKKTISHWFHILLRYAPGLIAKELFHKLHIKNEASSLDSDTSFPGSDVNEVYEDGNGTVQFISID